MEKKLYTIIVHSENFAGLLNQVTAVFTRRQINIESLNVSASSIQGVHKYTITAWTDDETIEKVVKQIEKKTYAHHIRQAVLQRNRSFFQAYITSYKFLFISEIIISYLTHFCNSKRSSSRALFLYPLCLLYKPLYRFLVPLGFRLHSTDFVNFNLYSLDL